MEIMTKQDYINRYQYKSGCEYNAMTKAQLVECITELANTLQHCGIEFMKPSGDSWDYRDEIDRWCDYSRTKLLPYHDSKRLMNCKKSELRKFVVVVDMACGALYEVNNEHPYHTIEKRIMKNFRG
jgi:hypothetical protein